MRSNGVLRPAKNEGVVRQMTLAPDFSNAPAWQKTYSASPPLAVGAKIKILGGWLKSLGRLMAALRFGRRQTFDNVEKCAGGKCLAGGLLSGFGARFQFRKIGQDFLDRLCE